jgi:hypothetical protein
MELWHHQNSHERTYSIRTKKTSDSENVIYVMTCDVYAKQYVCKRGETLRERMVNHRNKLHDHRERKRYATRETEDINQNVNGQSLPIR